MRHFRVFVSSPGDVAEERRCAHDILATLPEEPAWRGKISIEVVRWDNPNSPTPMYANFTPQEAVNRNLPKPSACDLVVLILWARFGTPLVEPLKVDGSRFLSGTEWEYDDARKGKVPILLHRRMSEPQVSLRDPDVEEKKQQLELVDAFFKSFGGAGGAATGGFIPYNDVADFKDKFRRIIESAIRQSLDAEASAPGASLEPSLLAIVDRLTRQFEERLAALAEQVARDKGVPAAPLRAILEKLGEAGVPDPEIPARLAAKADELLELSAQLGRLRNDRPELAAVRAEALRLIDRGDLDLARAALNRGREIARALREEASRSEAELLADEARIDHLQLAYRAAAAKYAEAAALVAPFERDSEFRYLLRQAGELVALGDEFGDNDALAEAIVVYRHALDCVPRATAPLDWAMTQNDLGTALGRLGARESGIGRLEEAVSAYRAALSERTRQRVPLDWATTQNNLGNALRTLGERESGTGRLEEAVATFRGALTERTRERVPLDWAMTQNNLGNALTGLGERESGTGRLEEAVTAYRASLTEWLRERVPLAWATAQNNLGFALMTLGERESGTGRLEEAVAAYRAALTEWPRGRVPLAWATAQNNLGFALATLGERESGTSRLEEAVVAYGWALTERTPERVPLDWAMTQNNLGSALAMLGERESDFGRLEAAVAAYRAALTERTRERVPLAWAETQNNLGGALTKLGERERGTGRLEEAVAAYRAALTERTRERMPLQSKIAQNNLARALQILRERGGA